MTYDDNTLLEFVSRDYKDKHLLEIKNSSLFEDEDNILLSRLKIVGASLRGGSWRERQVLEIDPYILVGVANSAAINNSFAVINNNQVTKG